MPTTQLADRSVVKVTGEDAAGFLQNLITCDVEGLPPGEARLGALLSPQGKILFDFLVTRGPDEIGGGFWFDTKRGLAADFVKRLSFYKLRAKVAVEDLGDRLAIVAGWGDAARPDDEIGLVHADGRHPALGWRAMVAAGDAAGFGDDEAGYHAHRVALGVPEGGRDFAFADTFPHEALMDQMAGVDFAKGCYVGQEVVSRMQHRGTARTRIVPLVFETGVVPPEGTEAIAGDKPLGHVGSGAQGRALAMLRLDRAADAIAAGSPITAGGMAARIALPDWVRFGLPSS